MGTLQIILRIVAGVLLAGGFIYLLSQWVKKERL
jgi:hypothetical protein